MIGNRYTYGSKGSNFSFQHNLMRDKDCIGSEVIELDSGDVVGFSGIEGMTYCLCSVEGGDGIRYWGDGSVPTLAEGHKMGDGDVFDVIGKLNINKVSIIGLSDGVKVMVSYYK